jgi:hypothetical protein
MVIIAEFTLPARVVVLEIVVERLTNKVLFITSGIAFTSSPDTHQTV